VHLCTALKYGYLVKQRGTLAATGVGAAAACSAVHCSGLLLFVCLLVMWVGEWHCGAMGAWRERSAGCSALT
jgi:hypothetical protein